MQSLYFILQQIDMASLHKTSQYLIVIVLLSVSSCTTLPWQAWNDAIVANSGNPLTGTGYTMPTIPTNWNRNYGVGALNTTYSIRKYQYLNYHINGSKTCKVYCGPRSFLIKDVNNTYICQRDNSSSYWGSLTDQADVAYQQYCIPNVQYSGTGSTSTSNACITGGNLNLSGVGVCDSDVSYNGYSSYSGCCFENKHASDDGNYILYDEVDFTVTGSPTDLLNSEFL